MQKSNAFSVQSEPVYSMNKIDDFAMIEVENEKLRK